MSSARVILCVDDDATGLTVRRLLLSIAGYKVLTATSAKNALQLLGCNDVDLVITDHFSSDVAGFEIVTEVKRLKPRVPVLLLTGLAEPPSGSEQADVLLGKGIMPEEFLSEIARLLSRPPLADAKSA